MSNFYFPHDTDVASVGVHAVGSESTTFVLIDNLMQGLGAVLEQFEREATFAVIKQTRH